MRNELGINTDLIEIALPGYKVTKVENNDGINIYLRSPLNKEDNGPDVRYSDKTKQVHACKTLSYEKHIDVPKIKKACSGIINTIMEDVRINYFNY